MNLTKIIAKRTIALVILRVSGTFAAGSIAGVELWQSALVAAFIGIMDVAENLSRAYVVDGELSVEEINTAFAGSAEAELSKNKSAEVATATAVVASAPVFYEEEDELEEIEIEEQEETK